MTERAIKRPACPVAPGGGFSAVYTNTFEELPRACASPEFKSAFEMNTIRKGSRNAGHSAVGGVLANDSSRFERCLDIPPMRIRMARTTALSQKT